MIALTHLPSPRASECLVTYIERQPIDLTLLNHQHEMYRRMLADAGVEVRVLDVNREHPDCVFIEDTAVVLDELAVMASFGPPSRRAEPGGIELELRRFRSTARITPPGTLEGGDVVRVGRKLLVGASSRTNAQGIEALRRVAPRYEVIAIPVHGCLHLKSACTALPDGRLLVNRAWLAADQLVGFDLIEVDPSEPHAANVVAMGERVGMASAYPKTAERLASLGFDVQTVDLSELAKAEGCATCLSLLIE